MLVDQDSFSDSIIPLKVLSSISTVAQNCNIDLGKKDTEFFNHLTKSAVKTKKGRRPIMMVKLFI
jgi:hypothetical protein